VCCRHPHLNLISDPASFSLTHRVGRIGPVTISELMVGSEMSMDGGEVCDSYRVLVLQAGRTDAVFRNSRVAAGPGSASVYAPDGLASAQWAAGSKMICLKIDRRIVDDAIADAIGGPVSSTVDFTPAMPVAAASTRSWISMVLHFKDQVFRPDSLMNQPLVGLPFADSLVRGFLLATEHPHRRALATKEGLAAPQAVRRAVDIIEADAHLPLTVSSIAVRCHASVRSLQEGFKRHLDTTPMAYLRDVRLRRAHHRLSELDPSTTSVSSIAHDWGFTNLGRFAAAYAARYGELPAVTLRRSVCRL